MSVRQGNVIIAGGNSVTVDQALDINSPNAIANSAVTAGLNGKEPTITGAATTITSNNLDVARAVITDANGKIAASTVTSTELGYIHGVTSGVQTQINAKANDNAVVHIASAETITGTKTFTYTTWLKLTDTDHTVAPSAYKEILYGIEDMNNKRIGTFGTGIGPNTTTVRCYMGASKEINGSYQYSLLETYIDDVGNKWTSAPVPAATNSTSNTNIATCGWVNNAALSTNVVHRSDAETIGGNKTFSGNIILHRGSTSTNEGYFYKNSAGDITLGIKTSDNLSALAGVTFGTNGNISISPVSGGTITAPASNANNSVATTVGHINSANGYYKFGNGLIVQWGTIDTTGSARSITYPTAFSSANYGFSIVPKNSTNSAMYTMSINNRTTTGCDILAGRNVENVGALWIAIGY